MFLSLVGKRSFYNDLSIGTTVYGDVGLKFSLLVYSYWEEMWEMDVERDILLLWNV